MDPKTIGAWITVVVAAGAALGAAAKFTFWVYDEWRRRGTQQGFVVPKKTLQISQKFFFFQAEDGIRDVAVTGVQTCALPISVRPCEVRWVARTEAENAAAAL